MFTLWLASGVIAKQADAPVVVEQPSGNGGNQRGFDPYALYHRKIQLAAKKAEQDRHAEAARIAKEAARAAESAALKAEREDAEALEAIGREIRAYGNAAKRAAETALALDIAEANAALMVAMQAIQSAAQLAAYDEEQAVALLLLH